MHRSSDNIADPSEGGIRPFPGCGDRTVRVPIRFGAPCPKGEKVAARVFRRNSGHLQQSCGDGSLTTEQCVERSPPEPTEGEGSKSQ